MPNSAHDRAGRGPFAALLLLLGLIIGTSTAAAPGADLRIGSASKPDHYRPSAFFRCQGVLADDKCGDDTSSFVEPPPPQVRTERLFERPGADGATLTPFTFAAGTDSHYLARAPPA